MNNCKITAPLFLKYKAPDLINSSGAFYGAGDGIRTRDLLLGRQELYQLSYSRKSCFGQLCEGRDLNPHGVNHQILSLARLPVSPPSRTWAQPRVKIADLGAMCKRLPTFFVC